MQRHHVRHHECVSIIPVEVIATFFREIGVVPFFVHRKKELFLLVVLRLLSLVLVQLHLGLLKPEPVGGINLRLEQAWMARLTLLHTVQ